MQSRTKSLFMRKPAIAFVGLVWQDDDERAVWNDTGGDQLTLKKLRLCRQELEQRFGGVERAFLKCVPALANLTDKLFVDLAQKVGFAEEDATHMFILILDVKNQLFSSQSSSDQLNFMSQGRAYDTGHARKDTVSKAELIAVFRATAPVQSLIQLKRRLKLRHRTMGVVMDAVFGQAHQSLDKTGFRDSMLRLGILGPEAGWLFYQIATNNLKAGLHPSSTEQWSPDHNATETKCQQDASLEKDSGTCAATEGGPTNTSEVMASPDHINTETECQQDGYPEKDSATSAAAEGGATNTGEVNYTGIQFKEESNDDSLSQVTCEAFRVSIMHAGGLDAGRLLKAELSSTISNSGGLRRFMAWLRGRRTGIHAGDHVASKFRQTLGSMPDPSFDYIRSNGNAPPSMSNDTAERLPRQDARIIFEEGLKPVQAVGTSDFTKVQKRHDQSMQAAKRSSIGAAHLASAVGNTKAADSQRNGLSLLDHGIVPASLMAYGPQRSSFLAHDVLRSSPAVQRMNIVNPSHMSSSPRDSDSAGTASSEESDSDYEFEYRCPDPSFGKRMTSKIANEAEQKWTKLMVRTFNQLILGPEVSPFQPMSRDYFVASVRRLQQISARGAKALFSLCVGRRPRANTKVAPVDILLRALGGFGQKYELLRSKLGLDQDIYAFSGNQTEVADGSDHGKNALFAFDSDMKRSTQRRRLMHRKPRSEKAGFVPRGLDVSGQLEFDGMIGGRQRADIVRPKARGRGQHRELDRGVDVIAQADIVSLPISHGEAANVSRSEQQHARNVSAGQMKQAKALRRAANTAVNVAKFRGSAKNPLVANLHKNQGISSGAEGGSEGTGVATKGVASWQAEDSPLSTDIEPSAEESKDARTSKKSAVSLGDDIVEQQQQQTRSAFGRRENLNEMINKKINQLINGKKAPQEGTRGLKHSSSTNFSLRDEVLGSSQTSSPTSPTSPRGQPPSRHNARLADSSSSADASRQNQSDMRIDAGMPPQSTPMGKENMREDEQMQLLFSLKLPATDCDVEDGFAVASEVDRMSLKNQAEAELSRVRKRLNLFDGNKTELGIALKTWQNANDMLLSSKVVKGAPQRAFQRLIGSNAAKLSPAALQECLVKVLKMTTLDALRAATVSTCVEDVALLGCPEFLQAHRFSQPVRSLLDLRMRFVQRFGTAAAGVDALTSLGLVGRNGMDDFSVDQLDRLMLGCGVCLPDASRIFEEIDALNLNKLGGFITIQHFRFALDSAQVIRWLRIFQQRLGGNAATKNAISEVQEEKHIGELLSADALLKLVEPLGFPEEFVAQTFDMLTRRLGVVSPGVGTPSVVSVQHLQTILERLPDEHATNLYAKATEPSQGLKAYRSMEDPAREEAALEAEQELRRIFAFKYADFKEAYSEFSPQDPEGGLSLDEWEKKRTLFEFVDPERWANIFGHMLEWQHPRWDKKCRVESKVSLTTLVKCLNDSLPIQTLHALRRRLQSLFSTPLKIWTALSSHDRAEEVSLAQWRHSLLAMGIRCSNAVHLWSLIMVSPAGVPGSFEGGVGEQWSLSKASFMAVMKAHAVEASSKLQELIIDQPVSTLFETCPYPRNPLLPDEFVKVVIPILRHARAVAKKSRLPDETLMEDAKMLFWYLDVHRDGAVPVDDLLHSMNALQACYMPAYSVPLRRKKPLKSRWKKIANVSASSSAMVKNLATPTPDGMRDTTSTFAPTEADAERPLTRDGSQDLFDDRPGTTPSHLRSVFGVARTLRPMTVPAEQQGSVSRSMTSFLGMHQEFQSQAGGSVDSGEEELQQPESPGRQEKKSILHAGGQAGQAALLKVAARFKKLPILSEKTPTNPPASQLPASGSQDHSPLCLDLSNLGASSGSSVTAPRASMFAPRGSMLHGSGGNHRAHVLQVLSKQPMSPKEDTAKNDVAGDSALVPVSSGTAPRASMLAPRGSMLYGSGGNHRAHVLQALSKQPVSVKEDTAENDVAGDSSLVPGMPEHPQTNMRSLAKPPGSAGHTATSPRKKSIYRTTAALTEMEAEVAPGVRSSFLEVRKMGKG